MDECVIERWSDAVMKICGIIDEDFINFKLPSMIIEFPYCNMKCDRESGEAVCQNSPLLNQPQIDVSAKSLYDRYISNPITRAIVCQGLEPFDSWQDLNELLFYFRIHESCFDPIVIYTGYNKEEIIDQIAFIKTKYSNIIIKFGRFIPNQQTHFDEVLGVSLASDNQYGEIIN